MFASLLASIVLLTEIMSEVAGGHPVHDRLHELTQRGNQPVDQQRDQQKATQAHSW